MSNEHIVRAWKDADYRSSLSAADRAMVPDNPAGLVELSDADLLGIEGGSTFILCVSVSVSVVVTVSVGVSAYASCLPGCEQRG